VFTADVKLEPVVEHKYGTDDGVPIYPKKSFAVLNPEGILIDLSDRIRRRDENPRLVSVDGRVTEVTEYHSENAPGSIRVIPSGITSLVKYSNS
jgi:hypothetical protein